MLSICTVHGYFRCVPPRLKRVLLRCRSNGDRSWRSLAGIVHPQYLASLVGEAVAIILVKRAVAVFSRIHTQFKWPVRFFAGILHHRLCWNNRASSNVKRHLIECGMQRNLIFAAEPLRSPIVIPVAGRELHFFGIDHLRGHRSDEEVAAEKEVAVVAVKSFGLRVVEKNRAHGGESGARGFFDRGVNVGKKVITKLHVAAANGFVLWAVDPRFLNQSTVAGVVAINGIQCANLEPTSKEIGGRRTRETTDIIASHPVTAKPQAEQHRRAHVEVIPGAAVVTGPSGGIALSASVGGAGEHEGPLVGLQLAQAVISGTNIFHSVDVVNGAMIERRAVIEAVPGV